MIYIIFFVVVLLIIIIRKKTRESFSFKYKSGDDPYFMSYKSFGCVDNIKYDLSFFNKKQGCREIKRDIPYFKEINDTDRKIKGDTIRNCNLLQDWMKEEKKAIGELIRYAQKETKCNFGFQRKIMSTPWKFVKVDSTVENGFPHTHNDIIFLPVNFISSIVSRLATDPIETVYNELGHILIHEKTHIWQRVEPELFSSFYKTIQIEKLKLSQSAKEWLRKNTRTNPDGLDLGWGYKNESGGYYVFVSLWNKSPNTLGDISNVAIPIVPNKTHSEWSITEYSNKNIIPITRLSSWKDNVGLSSNHYHPNEISAEGIARFTMKNKQILPIDIKIEEWLESLSIV